MSSFQGIKILDGMFFLSRNFQRFSRMPLRRKMLVGLVILVVVTLLQRLSSLLLQGSTFDEVRVGMTLPEVHGLMGAPRWSDRIETSQLSALSRTQKCTGGKLCAPMWALQYNYPVPLTLETKVLVVYFGMDFVVTEKSVHHSP